MFSSASVEEKRHYSLSFPDRTLYLAAEETGTLLVRIGDRGVIDFIDARTGEIVKQAQVEEDGELLQVAELDAEGLKLGLLFSNNRVHFIKLAYQVDFDKQGQRLLKPSLEYPFGETPISLDGIGPITRIAVQGDDESLRLAAVDDAQHLLLRQYEISEDEELPEPEQETLQDIRFNPDYLVFGQFGEWLYLARKDGDLVFYNLRKMATPVLVDSMHLVTEGDRITDLKPLLGRISLLVADNHGGVAQWSQQRDTDNHYALVKVRQFQSGTPVTQLIPERRRKGLLALNQAGELLIYYTTSERLLLQKKLFSTPVSQVALSSRGETLVAISDPALYSVYHVDNHYPEISWKSLWGKVQYEGYTQPDYKWQSSSADNDFEPKFSLTPLAFGTLKAAFYAMLVAMPLAIMGAIYTAYFMSPKMRGFVKPSIEIMEALPTVILGFLAGLWFAPFVEHNLLAVISLALVLPLGMLLFAWLWSVLPKRIRKWVPDGWQAALLVPVVILMAALALNIGPYIETGLFDGDIYRWMKINLGISYDQRNSLVVGVAMGIAVIPTIFSITEDAIFSVPRHLTNGSLALGATPWQTLTQVVILTASPGIFSAVMIGFGRAVGETMIVLMATGNTPVMDWSIFQGMRTLSANIAVELPESEVGSSHYRILFLAALVLFIVTFLFNTLAEVVRQRLRRRYGNI